MDLQVHTVVTPAGNRRWSGSGEPNSIGIGVMGGLISATLLGILFSPVLFVVVRAIFKTREADDVQRRLSPASGPSSK